MPHLSNLMKAKIIVHWEDNHSIKKIFLENWISQETRFNWGSDDTKKVIFSDENSFKTDKDGPKILWRRPGERYNPKNVLSWRTSGRITLGYWGWMSSMGPEEFGSRMNSEKYKDILKDVMVPTVRNVYPESRIYFIQDNCSVRRSSLVRQWLYYIF